MHGGCAAGKLVGKKPVQFNRNCLQAGQQLDVQLPAIHNKNLASCRHGVQLGRAQLPAPVLEPYHHVIDLLATQIGGEKKEGANEQKFNSY